MNITSAISALCGVTVVVYALSMEDRSVACGVQALSTARGNGRLR